MKCIFGYGSLMNPDSARKTLPGKRRFEPAALSGYQRKINAPVDGYLYLNLVPRAGTSVKGVLISISEEEYSAMRKREPGYEPVDVSAGISPAVDTPVIAFIAPDRDFPNMQIPRSYLETCLKNIPAGMREQWLGETAIENPIFEDLDNPVYENAAL